jgi:trans-aconitate 3-methyltransferase
MPGNRLVQKGYVDLVMPWNDAATAALFEQETFVRREFDVKSLIGDGFSFFSSGDSGPESPLKRIEALIGTMSPVTRWREAHPDLVGTDKDCVKVLIAQISEVLGEITSQEDLLPLMADEAAAVLSVKRVG